LRDRDAKVLGPLVVGENLGLAHYQLTRLDAQSRCDHLHWFHPLGGFRHDPLLSLQLAEHSGFEGVKTPVRLNARAVTLLSGSSVAPVYRFLLMLRNGEAADPPAFLTEQLDWQPGDVFVAANGRAFRIVDTDAEIEIAGMVLFDAVWTVEPLEESKDVISQRRR
jgi:hypothetical protein